MVENHSEFIRKNVFLMVGEFESWKVWLVKIWPFSTEIDQNDPDTFKSKTHIFLWKKIKMQPLKKRFVGVLIENNIFIRTYEKFLVEQGTK